MRKFKNLQTYANFQTHHGHVDVAGVELHVDLLVDESLRVGVEVVPDL